MLRVLVHNLRLGFATNSSSSHSLIFLPGLEDDLSGVEDDGRYGRTNFTLASREAKLPYLRLQVPESVVGELDLGAPVDGSIDHQSYWSGPDELLAEVARWALNEGVVILGGDDSAPHPDGDYQREIDPSMFGHEKVRKDPLGFWTVFDTWNGRKARLTFERAADPHITPFRSTWPELVDLKITDRCAQGCSYCYQDSRPDGAHGRLEDLFPIIARLAEAQVFEVVLGGGAPAEHPDFARIVAAIQQAKMRAAFTSRTLDFLDRLPGSPGVKWTEVAWALSVNDAQEVRRAHERIYDRGSHARQNSVWLPAIHVVMGTPAARPESLKAIAQACQELHLRLVLLGYKSTGRGARVAPEPDAHWVETCRGAGTRTIAIDTALAARYDLELHRAGVPEWLYDLEDGRFSMYVDAVRGLCGPSSYCEAEELFPLAFEEEGCIEGAFKRIDEQRAPVRLQHSLALEQLAAQRANDATRLVLLDAAMEGRCEKCGALRARRVESGTDRPRSLCPACT
jgi:hypothetical protein